FSKSSIALAMGSVDAQGRNVFDNGGPTGTAMMRHAVAGCLNAMHDSTLVFAPHATGYDRLE
ncbi:glutamine synthetase, partial [Citrobacter freundii]|uniref:glutamine synthetase n=1 Tax=Citrobacter freundii TaxID=546 RepID=UPI001EF80F30